MFPAPPAAVSPHPVTPSFPCSRAGEEKGKGASKKNSWGNNRREGRGASDVNIKYSYLPAMQISQEIDLRLFFLPWNLFSPK